MEKGADRKRYALAVTAVCALAQVPLSLLLRVALGDWLGEAASYWTRVSVQEALVWLLPALWLLPWRTRRLGPKKAVRGTLIACLPLGALVQLSTAGLRMLLPESGAAQMTPLPQTGFEWPAAVIALAVLPAVCEEAFFRGGLMGHLLDATAPRIAFGLCTLIFALLHGSVSGLLPHLSVSACCTLVMMSTGRVIAPMLLHLGFNAMALALPYLPGTPWYGVLGLIPLSVMLYLASRLKKGNGDKRLSWVDRALACFLLLAAALRYLPLT